MTRAEAGRLRYDVAAGVIEFSDNATITEGGNRISSNYLLYNINERRIKADSAGTEEDRVRIQYTPTTEDMEALEDADIDLVDGVLTVEFDDGSQLIINRQEPVEQIWVASPLGPAHFSYDSDQECWVDDKSGASLTDTLEKAFSEKLGQAVSLDRQF